MTKVDSKLPMSDDDLNDALELLAEDRARSLEHRKGSFVARMSQAIEYERTTSSARTVEVTKFNRVRTAVLAVAAALLLVMALPMVLDQLAPESSMIIAYRSGGSGPMATEMNRGDELFTATGERTMLTYDDQRVLVNVQESTRLSNKGSGRLMLNEGEVWVDVRPESGPFAVETPHGIVEVLGTKFGVAVDEHGTSVQIVRGRVRVSNQSGSTIEVTPGTTASVSLNAAPVAASSTMTEPPSWAIALMRDALTANAARRYPSGVPQNPGPEPASSEAAP